MIVYLRLAFGTACVLAPGWAVARAFGQRATSAVLAWALACVFVAWTAVFVLHRSIHLAVAVLAVLFVTALVVGVTHGSEEAQRKLRGSSDVRVWLKGPIWVAGTLLGWALWHVQSAVVGDGLFHEARVRKLVDLASLHLRSVDEFKDGGLHPGYAFPLWHGFLALVSWFSGIDPGAVVRHEPSLLAPLACVVAFEAGVALFGTRGAGVSVLLAQLAVFCFGPGHGGSYATLALPGTAARQLLAPAAIVLFFTSRPAATFAIFGALTLTHPTYTLFLLIPLAGYAIVRYADWREWWRVAVAALVPTGLVLLWLKPIVDETVSHNPKPGEVLRGLQHYGDQLVVTNDHHYRLAAEVFGRSGAVAVAALILLPVCAFAVRKKWAAFVARRNAADPAARRSALAVRPFLRRRVAVAGASRRRLRSVAVRARRCVRAARPVAACAARSTRGRDRAAAAVAGRLRLRPAPRRAGARDLDRAGRRRGCAPLRPRAAAPRAA